MFISYNAVFWLVEGNKLCSPQKDCFGVWRNRYNQPKYMAVGTILSINNIFYLLDLTFI